MNGTRLSRKRVLAADPDDQQFAMSGRWLSVEIQNIVTLFSTSTWFIVAMKIDEILLNNLDH